MFENTRTYIGLRTDEKTFIRNGDDGHMRSIIVILIWVLLVIVIVRVVKSKRHQADSDKKERSAKNKMIDDYIKEITDNNHNAEK